MTDQLTELQAAAERLSRDYPDRSPSVTLYNFSRMRMDDCCEAAVALPLLLARLADLERLRKVADEELCYAIAPRTCAALAKLTPTT